jgi:peroxiredoxin
MKPKLGKMLAEMKKVRAWQERFEPQAPKRGDLAPDFQLRDADGENPVRLSDFRGQKPVALVFGSYT